MVFFLEDEVLRLEDVLPVITFGPVGGNAGGGCGSNRGTAVGAVIDSVTQLGAAIWTVHIHSSCFF